MSCSRFKSKNGLYFLLVSVSHYEQAAFAVLLEERAAFLLPLWDFESRAIRLDAVETYINSASHGECILARFFLGLWFGENKYNFDLLDAVKTQDEKSMAIIQDWLASPYWP